MHAGPEARGSSEEVASEEMETFIESLLSSAKREALHGLFLAKVRHGGVGVSETD